MKRLVLAGGGHAHLFVLEALARRRRPNLHVTLVTPSRWQYYSGMIPGWMSGYYDLDACRIDLMALAGAAGAELILQSVAGMRADRACICTDTGDHIYYDLLSLDVGGEADAAWTSGPDSKPINVRPLSSFHVAWTEVIDEASAGLATGVAVIGGGAGGVELAFSARNALLAKGAVPAVSLVVGEEGPLPGFSGGARSKIERALSKSGIEVLPFRAVTTDEGILLSNGRILAADHVIVATGTRAPLWLEPSQLDLSSRGYVSVNASHQSVSHPNVFAVGDVCERTDVGVVKSGVHSVRAGPILAYNLFAALADRPLRPYRPARNVLYLLSTRDRHAVASWGKLSAEGRWVWNWKDTIDRSFVRRFSDRLSRATEGESL